MQGSSGLRTPLVRPACSWATLADASMAKRCVDARMNSGAGWPAAAKRLLTTAALACSSSPPQMWSLHRLARISVACGQFARYGA